MIQIALHGAEFFAYHGFYPEEQILGTQFLVDIDVSVKPGGDLVDDEISYTVNYEDLYEIAREEMQHPKKLIETVAQGIINQVKAKYPDVEAIQVSIKKLNPPLGSKVAYSNVLINYNRA